MSLTVVSLKSGDGDNSLRVELSDGSLFSFKTCYLPPMFADEELFNPFTAIGREINTDDDEAIRFASACLRAEKRALQLIARAEQNVFGITRKLQKHGHENDCVRAVVDQLCEMGLLDDRRYACLWLEARIMRQATSPRRLLAALRSRGIDRHDAEAALKETLNDEVERQLLERYVQKLRRKDGEPADTRALRYTLKGEGFSSLSIEIVLDQ